MKIYRFVSLSYETFGPVVYFTKINKSGKQVKISTKRYEPMHCSLKRLTRLCYGLACDGTITLRPSVSGVGWSLSGHKLV